MPDTTTPQTYRDAAGRAKAAFLARAELVRSGARINDEAARACLTRPSFLDGIDDDAPYDPTVHCGMPADELDAILADENEDFRARGFAQIGDFYVPAHYVEQAREQGLLAELLVEVARVHRSRQSAPPARLEQPARQQRKPSPRAQVPRPQGRSRRTLATPPRAAVERADDSAEPPGVRLANPAMAINLQIAQLHRELAAAHEALAGAQTRRRAPRIVQPRLPDEPPTEIDRARALRFMHAKGIIK